MNIILICVLSVITLVEGVLFYRDYYVKQKLKKNAKHKYKLVEPLLSKLASNEEISEVEILTIAKDPSLRCGLFKMLDAYDRKELFPTAYLTTEKGAEAFLVNWLEFPTELGNAPDEIEVIAKITLEEEAIDYYVFKYKTQTPHWAKHLDWMIGVSGPYHENSLPYDVPIRVFSRFNPLGSILPEMEVRWVHQNINPSLK